MFKSFLLAALLLFLMGSSLGCGSGFNTLIISSVQVFRLPSIDVDGSTWDEEDENFLPDVYFEIVESENFDLLYSLGRGSHYTDAGRNSVLVWTTQFELPVFQEVDFDLYDFDTDGSDEYLGTVRFTPNEFADSEAPTEVTLIQEGISVRFQVDWR